MLNICSAKFDYVSTFICSVYHVLKDLPAWPIQNLEKSQHSTKWKRTLIQPVLQGLSSIDNGVHCTLKHLLNAEVIEDFAQWTEPTNTW